MNTPAQQWLAGRASPPGTLACGLRGPDGKCVSHSVEEICPPAILEKILGRYDDVRAAFSGRLAPRWHTWVFDQAQIRYVERPDGWLLALVVRVESEAQPKLDPISVEFLSLE